MKILETSKDANPNYLAQIVVIDKIEPHPNADKLVLATVCGSVVITGLDARAGNLYVYFPLECVISQKFLSWSNSYDDPELNADKKTKLFFGPKGRVRAIKLRSVYSNGYIVPVQALVDFVKEVYDQKLGETPKNTSFDTVCGELFVNKYIPPIKNEGTARNLNKSKGNVKKFNKLVPMQHAFYPDTLNLRRVISEELRPDDEIIISKKYHGSSGIVSNVLVYRQLTFWEKILIKLFGVKIPDKEYGLLAASRTVIKNI